MRYDWPDRILIIGRRGDVFIGRETITIALHDVNDVRLPATPEYLQMALECVR